MGQWSLNYYDDVLSAKIKGLVGGAILRARLEETDPIITYETFVKDLDAGDSFTTSLIDILVKELAERQMRPPEDRRLIADRSAKSLRMLATHLRVYRARHDEMDVEDDDDEFASMLGSAASAAEGARINPEVYDAFNSQTHRWSHPATRRPQASSSAAVTSAGSEDARDPPTPPLYSPPIPNRSGPWTMPSNPGLFRQPSIRRPVRSRIVDFNDFTTRRRSAIRQSSAHELPGSRSEASSDDPGRSLSPWEPPLQDEPPPVRPPQPVRRFFGPNRNRRHETNGNTSWNENVTERSNTELSDDLSPYIPTDPSFPRSWVFIPTPSSSSSSQSEVESVGERERAPRLRRGGLRAPESMLSRHASPNPTEQDTTDIPPSVTIHLPVSPVSENDHDGTSGASANPSEPPGAPS